MAHHEDNDFAEMARLTRRQAIRTSGGLVLAVGGLLAPAWVPEEAEAGGHPVRRIQDRKERPRPRRRRTHGDDKGNKSGKDRGRRSPAASGGVQWDVETVGQPFDIELWEPHANIWSVTESRRLAAGGFHTFPMIWPEAVLWINHRYFVTARCVSGPGYVALGHGGAIGIAGGYWHGGTEAVPLRELRQEDQEVTMTVDNIRFTVVREPEDYRWFYLRIE